MDVTASVKLDKKYLLTKKQKKHIFVPIKEFIECYVFVLLSSSIVEINKQNRLKELVFDLQIYINYLLRNTHMLTSFLKFK